VELPWQEMKALQDHLFRRCVRKAVEYRLPVKLHTGYYAGNSYMQLDRVSQNPAHLCVLLQDFPDATFDIFHIGYPYQEEMIALAKHYPNACVDMCWAWIINPEACVRFLRDYRPLEQDSHIWRGLLPGGERGRPCRHRPQGHCTGTQRSC